MGCSDYVLCSLFLLMLLCNLGPTIMSNALYRNDNISSHLYPNFSKSPFFHPSSWRTCWSLSCTKYFEMTMILVVLSLPAIKHIIHHGAFGYNLWTPFTLNRLSSLWAGQHIFQTNVWFLSSAILCCRYLSDNHTNHVNIIMARQTHKQAKLQPLSLYPLSLYPHISLFIYLLIWAVLEIAQCHVTRMYYNCRCTLCIFESHFPSFWECFPHSMA